MATRVVLWDFGDTLVDQHWMLQAPDSFPEWPQHWQRVLDESTAEAWFLGELKTEDIAQRMADSTGISFADVMQHMRAASKRVHFYPEVARLLDRTHAPHAIVTVNPDLFSQWIVPDYALADKFHPIVTSWEERSLDKAELCRIALDRFPEPVRPEHALLVDNLRENVEAWKNAGALGYIFAGESRVVELEEALLQFLNHR